MESKQTNLTSLGSRRRDRRSELTQVDVSVTPSGSLVLPTDANCDFVTIHDSSHNLYDHAVLRHWLCTRCRVRWVEYEDDSEAGITQAWFKMAEWFQVRALRLFPWFLAVLCVATCSCSSMVTYGSVYRCDGAGCHYDGDHCLCPVGVVPSLWPRSELSGVGFHRPEKHVESLLSSQEMVHLSDGSVSGRTRGGVQVEPLLTYQQATLLAQDSDGPKGLPVPSTERLLHQGVVEGLHSLHSSSLPPKVVDYVERAVPLTSDSALVVRPFRLPPVSGSFGALVLSVVRPWFSVVDRTLEAIYAWFGSLTAKQWCLILGVSGFLALLQWVIRLLSRRRVARWFDRLDQHFAMPAIACDGCFLPYHMKADKPFTKKSLPYSQPALRFVLNLWVRRERPLFNYVLNRCVAARLPLNVDYFVNNLNTLSTHEFPLCMAICSMLHRTHWDYVCDNYHGGGDYHGDDGYLRFLNHCLSQVRAFRGSFLHTELGRVLENANFSDEFPWLGICDADFNFAKYLVVDKRDPALRYTDILVPYTTLAPFRVYLTAQQAVDMANAVNPGTYASWRTALLSWLPQFMVPFELDWVRELIRVVPNLSEVAPCVFCYTAMVPWDPLQQALVKFSADWSNFTPSLITKWCCSDGTRNLSPQDCQAMTMYFPRLLERIVRRRRAIQNFL